MFTYVYNFRVNYLRGLFSSFGTNTLRYAYIQSGLLRLPITLVRFCEQSFSIYTRDSITIVYFLLPYLEDELNPRTETLKSSIETVILFFYFTFGSRIIF